MESVLSGLASERATGALRLGEAGMFYLTGGRVTHAESAAAPRVEDLLTAGRRVSARAVQQARQEAGEDRHGGELLVSRGVLTRGELEFCVMSAVLDAVYFLFQASGDRSGFRPGERHWLGPQWYFDVTGLLRECGRRRAQLDQAWPSAELDSRPVIPLGRIPAQRVVLTSLQWEVLVAADSAATPGDLARRLGRPAGSVLLAVRQLAAAGLLSTSPAEPAPALAPAPSPTGLPKRKKGGTAGTWEFPGAAAGVTGLPGSPPGSSPGSLSGPLPGSLPAATADPADINLLIRLKNALEALT
ncbi:DUF4388 domain-containing protein [Streptosporangium sp. CA-135522]|uniref:DUF4388 domain-containing protein n=1 Tax=Streptosporangium sp. CA-135522 TaxID=3240072 RepID=UPI003D8F6621